MTYKELINELAKLSEEQLACKVLVELGPEDEIYPAELKICTSQHDMLTEDYPVIFA